MTERTFFSKLKATRRDLQWKITTGRKGEETGRPLIRGRRGKKQCCPITAVYLSKTGNFVDVSGALDVCEEIDLDVDFAEMVIQASDLPADAVTTGILSVRRRLLRALGLEEAAKFQSLLV